MKISKTNSLLRLVAFLLITVVFIGVVGVVSSEGTDKNPEEDAANPPQSSIQSPPATDVPAVLERYENYLSGLFCSSDESKRVPHAYLLNPSSPLYGIEDAELTIEFPVEFGQSRLLVYTTKTVSLGKIGAIAPLRNYMSVILSSFGGILIHNGTDDTVEYSANNTYPTSIDLSKTNAYSYSEGYGSIYTNANLMANAIEGSRFETELSSSPVLPYVFGSSYESNVYGSYSAQSITIPFGAQSNVKLIYDTMSGEYRYEHNGQLRVDYHSGEAVHYKNALILFCDSTTYEKADTTELVPDTTAGGQGYYLTNGTLTRFLWECDENGRLLFKDSAGQKLIINRGSTYIAFFKTTQKASVSIY